MVDSYNPYTDPTKFTNTVASNPYYLQLGLSDEDLRRVNQEILLWRYYRGKQWRGNSRVDEAEPQITANYCKAFVNKGVAFLMGKSFSINTKSEAREIVKPLLDHVWDDNNRELVGLDMAQSGGVTGNAWVKVSVEYFDEKERPVDYALYPNGRIRILVLPTYTVFPLWDAHDRETMVKCTIVYPITLQERNADGTFDSSVTWYREEITKEEIREYYDEELIAKRENAIGEIPIVRIKNLPTAGQPLGMSDLEDIVSLQKELNVKATDISDIINYHAAPITIIKGAKSSNLEKGARKVWGGLPKDATVENLELKTDLTASMRYLDFVKTSMFELAHMPEDAFGKQLNISNTSGIALHIKNQPIMEVTRTKHLTYGDGISKINRLILLYAQLIEHPEFDVKAYESLNPLEKYWTEITFSNPLPKDELIQMQIIAQKIKLFLMSRKDALTELGETDTAEKLEDILQEAQRIESLVYESTDAANDAQDLNMGGILNADDRARDESDATS